MTVTKDNSIYEKTSFLSKSNSAFIESMYLKYINSDPELSQDWNEFFDGLGDETKYILNEYSYVIRSAYNYRKYPIIHYE